MLQPSADQRGASVRALVRGWRRIRPWVWVGGGSVLFAYLLTRISFQDLSELIRRANAGLLVLAVVVGLAITAVRAWRYAFFFPPGERRFLLYRVFAMLRLLNYALPLRSGELITLGMLKRHGLAPTIAEASPVWLLLRITDFVALLVLMCIAVILDANDGHTTSVMRESYLLMGAASVGVVGVLWLIGRKFARQPHEEPGEGWLQRRLHTFRLGLHRVSSVRTNLLTVALGLVIWAGNVGSFVLVILAFPVEIPWDAAMMATCIALGINLLPLRAPLGLGTGDAAWTGAFILYGLPTDQAIALTLAVRLVQMVMIGIDGLVGFVPWTKDTPAEVAV